MAKIKLTKSVVAMAQVQTRDVKLGTQSFRASCARLHLASEAPPVVLATRALALGWGLPRSVSSS